MKKGFTLIELLAVIVILAIIALIATPIVLNIIEDSKERAFKQTGNGIVDAAEYYYMKEMSDGAKPTENKVFTFNGSTSGLEGLEFDGEIPKEGTLTVDVNGKVELVAHNNQYCITKGYEENEVTIKKYAGGCNASKVTYTSGILSSESSCIINGDCKEGTPISVKVNETQTFRFYVLNKNEDGTTNLIMDRNIYYDAEDDISSETTSTNTGGVAWYAAAEDNSFGPVTAMDYLYNATKDWINIPDMIMNYTDEGNTGNYGYGGIKTEGTITRITKKDGTAVTVLTDKEGYTNLKARMPYKSEVADSNGTNDFLYNNLHFGGCYDNDEYLNEVSCDEAGYIEGVYSTGIAHIDGIYGYWTLSSFVHYNDTVFSVGFLGRVFDAFVTSGIGYGVRPVITLKI